MEYYLKKNPFGNQSNYVAQTITAKIYNTDDVIRRMLGRGSTLTEPDLKANLSLLRQVIIDILSEGGTINIEDFLHFKFSISGVFERPTDSFDASKHTVNVNVNVSQRLIKELVNKANPIKVESTEKRPVIKMVHDLESDSLNKLVTNRNMVRIEGTNLAFDKDKEDEGIYIIAGDESKELKVKYKDKMSSTSMVFMLPDLISFSDKVYIEVRTRMNTKTLRNGRTSNTLNMVISES